LVHLNHGTNAVATSKRSEAFVDLVEPYAPGDELVQHQSPVEVFVDDPWKIARAPHVAIARSHDALLAHQRTPAEAHVFVDIDLAEPDRLPAGPQRFHRETEGRDVHGDR